MAAYGGPEVLELKSDVPEPEVGPGQVRVRMQMASINPSDMNFIRGTYHQALARLIWNRGKETACFDPARAQPCPVPPYALGNEGMGTVDACGSGMLARRIPKSVRLRAITVTMLLPGTPSAASRAARPNTNRST